MKKLLAILAMASALVANATELSFAYKGNDTGITLLYVTGIDPYPSRQSADIVIPSEYDGSPVTQLGDLMDGDFFNETVEIADRVRSVTIPASVEKIDNIFIDCVNLESVTFGEGSRFHTQDNLILSTDNTELVCSYGKKSLTMTSVNIPDTVEKIGNCALFNCRKLKDVVFPKGVTEIGCNPFIRCYSLQNAVLEEGCEAFKVENGLLLSADGTVFLFPMLPVKPRRDIVVPEGVEHIIWGAFEEEPSRISRIWLPSTLEKCECCFEWGSESVVVFQNTEEFECGDEFCDDCNIKDMWFKCPPPNGSYKWYGKVGTVHVLGENEDDWREYLNRCYRFTGKLVVNDEDDFPVAPAVDIPNPHPLRVTVDGDGSVAGTGIYKPGAKVALKATPAKGYVFAGWYASEDGDVLEGSVDYRMPSMPYTMPACDVTVYAKFIALAEDSATVSCEVDSEYVTKQAIDPIAIDVSGCSSFPTVKATGLPSGLKFTAKALDVKATKTTPAAHYDANTIYGTPTKSGIYTTTITATTAGKKSAATNLTFIVINRDSGERILRTDHDASMGKVTGAGIYKSGAKVSLKATANAAKKATKTTPAQEATVFAGWYYDESYASPLSGASDYRSLSYSMTMPGEDTTVYAKFVLASEDASIALAVGGEELTDDANDAAFYTDGSAMSMPVEIESHSLPKVTFTGLPAGLKYTAKQVLNKDKSVLAEANTIYGTATKPGTYVVTAKVTNTTVKKALERKFTIVVDNLTGANDVLVCTDADGNAVALANARGESYALTVGVSELLLPRKIVATVGTVKVTGLPTGLKYDAKTGAISGVATKAGTYTVYVTVGKTVSTFTVVVEALPSWTTGTFEGYGTYDDSPFDAKDFLVSVAVSSAGKVSGKFIMDNSGDGANPTATFSEPSFAGIDDSGCYYCNVSVKFAKKGLSDEVRNCRLAFYENEDGIGQMRCAGDDPFVLDVAQRFMKTSFAKRFKFPKTGISDSYTHAIEGDDETEGTSTIKLTVNSMGTVKAEGVDEGTDCGKRFRDTYKSTCSLVVLELDDHSAKALAAFKCSDGTIWWIYYTLADTDKDGVLDGLEITDTVVFWDWSD